MYLFLAQASSSTLFYQTGDFWIFLAIGLAGLYYSVQSYREAGKAKQEAEKAKSAAIEAGQTVKLQTVVVELSEIRQRLDSIDDSIDYSWARDLLSDSSCRLHRYLTPFLGEPELKEQITSLYALLETASSALKGLRSTKTMGTADVTPGEVYYELEAHFSVVAVKVSDLIGLLEKRTLAGK